MHATDIAAWVFAAELWCPYCVTEHNVPMTTMAESDYDSSQFAKPVFGHEDLTGDYCAQCWETIV